MADRYQSEDGSRGDSEYEEVSESDLEAAHQEAEAPAVQASAAAVQVASVETVAPAAPVVPAPAQAVAPSGLPSLPARSTGGLGLGLPPRGLANSLPPRGTAAATSSTTAPVPASMSTQQEAAPAAVPTPAPTSSAMPRLPPKPVGGLGVLPPRPAAGSSSTRTAATTPPTTPVVAVPATPAASTPAAPPTVTPPTPAPAASRPSLPPRPIGRTASAASSSPPAPAVPPPAAPASAPTRPAGLGLAGGLGPRPAAPAPQPTPPQSQVAVVPPAPVPPTPSNEVVDPSEARPGQRIQSKVQSMRVQLIRAAGRLGLRYDSEQVQQFMGVINRIENMAGPNVYKGAGRRLDLVKEAERIARQLDGQQAADSKLDVKVKVLLIGVSGTGKSELINALLERPAARTSAFTETTRRVRVVKGSVRGIQLELIDTPGLSASSNKAAENKATLKAIKAAYLWHKPNYVFWVDRLDSGRPALGDLPLLGLINEALGKKVWRETMVVLTHAHACRAAHGSGYDQYTRQRRNIVSQVLRQAAGDPQVRNPMFMVDCHPSCPTNSFGQPIIYEGAQAVAWKQALLMQLVGYRLYESVQSLFRDAQPKPKAAPAAAAAGGGAQADMFRQMMRPRLPPVSYFVEQACEGVLAPDTWGAMEDPMDQGTEDLEAEEFEHVYYRQMYTMACDGNPWAQKEYALMLNKQDRTKGTYAEAFANEDIEQLAAAGYEGYVAEGLDLGPSFDPEDGTNHRYVYAVPEADWQIMPTLDYYGYEHEDAINGFVAEWDGQPFNRDGWGGVPLNLHLAVEKDKTNFCLQGESSMSLIHCVPPWGARHISQVAGSFEMLRPNVKDVLYQLDINSFKDGLITKGDHAGVGLMMTRLGEKGSLTKGPIGFGFRLQDTFELGPFKFEGACSKCVCESAQGGRDEAWGARSFVQCNYLPGVGMLFDFYQQRTKETDAFNIMGGAANFTYDFAVGNTACGVEVDYLPGQDSMHMDLNLFNGNSYQPAWLLLLPAFNFVKNLIMSWREGQGGEGEEMFEEGDEEEDPTAGMSPEQLQQVQMQAMMKQLGMA